MYGPRSTMCRFFPGLFLLVFAFPLAVAATAQAAETSPAHQRVAEQEEYYQLFKMLADALDEVERNYVQKVDRRELMEEAIEGIIQKLDPYSDFIPAEELAEFRTSVTAQFGGIGVQVAVDNERLTVMSPLIGTPAYRAGVQAGDWIAEIEGESTEGITLAEAVKKMKGPAGTKIRFAVVHPGKTERVQLEVEREIVHVETVLGDRRTKNDNWDFLYDHRQRIGYIRITAFSRDTAGTLRSALEELQQQKLRGLILDLRFNPGGLLSSAIEICDMFINEGKIVSTEGRNTKTRSWNATKADTFAGFPMVVLVNRFSASASEIVAGCLQDHQRAVIIGERTWGKGSVQNIIELDGGRSALKLTTSAYQRPSGKNIHRFPKAKQSDEWGVQPNKGYKVPLELDAIGELMQVRRERDVLNTKYRFEPLPKEGAPPEPNFDEPIDSAEVAAVDPQLQRAIDYLSTEIARGPDANP